MRRNRRVKALVEITPVGVGKSTDFSDELSIKKQSNLAFNCLNSKIVANRSLDCSKEKIRSQTLSFFLLLYTMLKKINIHISQVSPGLAGCLIDLLS
jgi:hypothetical protein